MLPLEGKRLSIDCLAAGAGRPAEVHLVPQDGFDLVVLLDASVERKRRQEVQQKANELDLMGRRQARLIEDLDAFAHTVAHDLRSPLTAITGFAELLLADQAGMLNESQRESLDYILQSGRKMVRIIEELMLLAGLRRQTVTPQAIDMAAVLGEVKLRLGPALAEAGAELVEPESWPRALGHAPWVEEAWANYISNAIKYGGRPPRVTVGADALPGGTVKFWVRDNGPGVPPERAATLFGEHAQAGGPARGHGLGLAIVRRIVERLNGSVGYEPAPGGGSSFSFTLPAA
jgi:signal transduction histidine kinase